MSMNQWSLYALCGKATMQPPNISSSQGMNGSKAQLEIMIMDSFTL